MLVSCVEIADFPELHLFQARMWDTELISLWLSRRDIDSFKYHARGLISPFASMNTQHNDVTDGLGGRFWHAVQLSCVSADLLKKVWNYHRAVLAQRNVDHRWLTRALRPGALAQWSHGLHDTVCSSFALLRFSFLEYVWAFVRGRDESCQTYELFLEHGAKNWNMEMMLKYTSIRVRV